MMPPSSWISCAGGEAGMIAFDGGGVVDGWMEVEVGDNTTGR